MMLLAGVGIFAALAAFMFAAGARGGSPLGLVAQKDAFAQITSSRLGHLKERLGRLSFVRSARERAAQLGLSTACEQQMPELLDILALGLSAGLSFDASLELYCARSETRLSHELAATMRSWQMGIASRSGALGALAERIDSPSLRRFCASVCEALAFGAPLASTLERQADLIREEQKSITQERIEEVPVRMLVPLGTLVVPAMLLAILGPLLAGALNV